MRLGERIGRFLERYHLAATLTVLAVAVVALVVVIAVARMP